MKKQTESFYIDLSKVDRLQAEKVIRAAGGVFSKVLYYRKWCDHIFYMQKDKDFSYVNRVITPVVKTITSIAQLRKQLGNVPDSFLVPNCSMENYEKIVGYLDELNFSGKVNYDPFIGMVKVESDMSCKIATMPSIKITQIFPELKEPVMKEKEYALKNIYNHAIKKYGNVIEFKKGTKVELIKEYWINSSRPIYKISGTDILVSDKYVEEKQPLLSEVVKFGDELITKKTAYNGVYIYLGYCTLRDRYYVNDAKDNVVKFYTKIYLNESFKLK